MTPFVLYMLAITAGLGLLIAGLVWLGWGK